MCVHFIFIVLFVCISCDSMLCNTVKIFIQFFRRRLKNLILFFRHTASVAAGNHGIPVIVARHHFGNASGMAPRAQ